MTDANCMRLSVQHAPHTWTLGGNGTPVHSYQCDGTPARVSGTTTKEPEQPPARWGEIAYERKLQSLALHTIFAALGGMHVYGGFENQGTVMDDTSSVRQVQRHTEPDGKRYAYTTNVTVSVSRVELK